MLDEGKNACEDEHRDAEGADRVCDEQAVVVDEQRRKEHAEATQCVGHDMQEDAVHVIVDRRAQPLPPGLLLGVVMAATRV